MIGDIVKVTVDRPLGSYHPEHKDMYYPINYGYIEGIVMIKYVLCLVTVLLLVVDSFIYFDLKKYIKVNESELVENHIKGLLGRAVAMTVISVCVGVIAIILQII